MSRKVGGREATTGVIPGRYCLSVGKPDLPTPEGWSWRPLLEIARLESGHTPSRRKPEYWGGDVSWIGIKDATGNHGQTIHQTIQHTNELGIANSAARILPENTVCLSRTASVGYVVVMGKPMATSQDFANWVCGPELDYRFLKYALLTENEALHRFSYGSTHRTIYYPELKAFHVCLPERKKQVEIANTLQALDDKIELNRKTAATLEEMARALYRSWFVDFDPVHAKAAGRAPAHMDTQTADLFPDSFAEDGLPEGWELGSVTDVFDVVMGQSPPGSTYNKGGEGLPFFQGRTDFGFRFPTCSKFCTAPSRIAPRDSILLSVRAPVGDLNRAWEECCIGRGVASLSERSGRNAYGYEAIWSLSEDLKSYDSEGTVFGSINKKQLAGLEIIVPPELLKDAYEAEVGAMDAQIRNIVAENQTLATLRDTLLPRLMSGELSVGNAKKELEISI